MKLTSAPKQKKVTHGPAPTRRAVQERANPVSPPPLTDSTKPPILEFRRLQTLSLANRSEQRKHDAKGLLDQRVSRRDGPRQAGCIRQARRSRTHCRRGPLSGAWRAGEGL